MAVLRIERNGEVVSDAYLWDGRLSLKSKGLLQIYSEGPGCGTEVRLKIPCG